jgi:hypothetical protein
MLEPEVMLNNHPQTMSNESGGNDARMNVGTVLVMADTGHRVVTDELSQLQHCVHIVGHTQTASYAERV